MKGKKVAEKKKTGISSKNLILIIIVAALITLIALVALGVLKLNSFNSNNEGGKNLSLNDFYSDENCRCLKKERKVCNLEGFEYNVTRNLCVNSAEKTVTYPLLACSLYECSGTAYSFNNKTNGWESN